MATEFTATVKSSGGDYTSLNAAEAGLQNDLTLATIKVFSISAYSTPTIAAGDTVLGQTSTATGICVLVNAARTQILIKTIAVASFQSGEVVQKTTNAGVTVTLSNAGDSPICGIACDAISDTTAVTVDGWTTSATNYINIYAATGNRHDGKWSTSGYRLSINGATCLTIQETYTRCEWLQVEDTGTAGAHSLVVMGAGGDYFRFGHGIIRKSVADLTVHIGFYTATNGLHAYIYDTLIYNIGNASYDDSGAGVYVYWYNCTAYNNATKAFHSWGSRGVAKNCVVQAAGTDGFNGNWDTTNSTNNVSNKASDCPGANPSDSASVTFVNAGAGDFHLSTSDTVCKGTGVDLSGDAIFPFSTDIDNETITGSWCRGMDWITSGGGGPVIPVFMNQYRQRRA